MLTKKFLNVGFEDLRVVERIPFGLEEIRRYPLFAPDFLDFLRSVVPERRHRELVQSIVVTGRKPENLPAPGA